MGLDIPGFTNYLAGLVPSFQGARLREKERGRSKEDIGLRQKRRLKASLLQDFESALGKACPEDWDRAFELLQSSLPGISTMYHYQYEFTEADVFVGLRVFYHEGIGCGKFYTAKECDSMLLEHEGLNEATVGELRMATSTLQD